MLYLLILVPWVLTVAALLIIMVRRNNENEEEPEGFPEIIRVAMYEDKAYWVYENVFYQSETVREPDFETARPIDTMDMPPKDLDKLLAILDELQESEKE